MKKYKEIVLDLRFSVIIDGDDDIFIVLRHKDSGDIIYKHAIHFYGGNRNG